MKLWKIQLISVVGIAAIILLYYFLIGTSSLPDWVKFALLK